MPDHRTARPSDGGYRDRTGDLLLAKAQERVHEGAPQGTDAASLRAAAAAAATRERTAPESLRETDPVDACIVCGGTGAAHGDYGDTASAWCDACEGTGAELYGWTLAEWNSETDWDALEHHARALDRSDATHTLRVRHHQALRCQRHVRTAVGW